MRTFAIAFAFFLVSGIIDWAALQWEVALAHARHVYLFLFYYPDTPEVLGDGRPAVEIKLHDPMGIAEDGAGNVYVSDRGRSYGGRLYRGSVIWRIDPSGRAQIVAGTGYRGGSRTGIPAVQSDLGSLEGLDVDRRGYVYFADSRNHQILRLELDGTLTRVAGLGGSGYAGDHGPASAAKLNRPYDVRVDRLGNLYVAEHGNHRIRRILRDGTIETVVGTGVAGYSGDGGPAIQAQLRGPYGIAFDDEGRLLIADSENHVIRRVELDGRIVTIAGSGRQGFTGDGGDALSASFDTPQSLAWYDGMLFVGDEHNNRIRVVLPGGRVETFAGCPASATGAGALRPAMVPLNDPENILVRADGSILVTDADHNRVLRIALGEASVFAGSAEGAPITCEIALRPN